MFVSALNEWIYSAIESGLKKDSAQAKGHMSASLAWLERAKSRTDQEEPKRAFFKGNLRRARGVRRG